MFKQIFLPILAMINAASCSSFDATVVCPPKPTIYGRLNNGFTYYLHRIEGAKIEAHFLVKIGSNQESAGEKQLSHILEHAAMNKTEYFPNPMTFFQENGIKLGAEFNAVTGDNLTDYWLKLPATNDRLLDFTIKFFRECANRIIIDDQETEVIRAALLEEARTQSAGVDMQNERLLLMGKTVFADHYSSNAVSAIQSFSRASLLEFYEKWYRPNTQAITIVGEFNVAEAEKTIKYLFSQLPPSTEPKVVGDLVDTSFFSWENRVLEVNRDVNNLNQYGKIYIKLPTRIIRNRDDYDFLFSVMLYNKMVNRRFQASAGNTMQHMRKPPLYKYSFEVDGPDFDVITCEFNFDRGRLKPTLHSVFVDLEQIRRFGFSNEEFKQAIQDIRLEGNLFSDDDASSYAQRLSQHFVSGQTIYDADARRRIFKQILRRKSVEKLNDEVAQWFTLGKNFDLIMFNNSNSPDTLPPDTLQEIHKCAVNGIIAPTTITVSQNKVDYKELLTKRFIRNLLPDKNIIIKRNVGLSNITILKLTNGIEFYLKSVNDEKTRVASLQSVTIPTNNDSKTFDEHKISLGLSVMARSGLGNLTASELREVYKRNGVSRATVQSTESGVQFNAQFEEDGLEEVLQAAFLYMTNPKFDNVDLYYRDQKLSQTAQDEPVSEDQLRKSFMNVFANTVNKKFILTGVFSEKEAIKMISLYFGSIPKRVSSVQHVHQQYEQPNLVTAKQRCDSSDICHVRLTASSDLFVTVPTNIALEVVTDYLQVRLFKRLREREKGVYSVSVNVYTDKHMFNGYTIQISFSCSPVNVERLIRSVKDEIAILKLAGVPLNVVQNFLKVMNLNIQTSLLSNDFWSHYISFQIETGRPLDEIYEELEATSDTSLINEAMLLLLQTELNPSQMHAEISFPLQ